MLGKLGILPIIGLALWSTTTSGCGDALARARMLLKDYPGVFKPSILTKNIGGSRRIVVMLPETHAKTKRTREVTSELMGSYPLLGVENLRPSGLVGKITSWLLVKTQLIIRTMSRLSDSNLAVENSEQFKLAFLSMLQERLIADLEEKFDRPIDDVSDQELLAAKYSSPDGEPYISGVEILQALRPNSPHLPPSLKPLRKYIDLEANHKPSLAYQIHTTIFNIGGIGMVPWAAAAMFHPDRVRGSELAVTLSVYLICGEFILYAAAHPRFGKSKWLFFLTPLSSASGRSRNQSMAANIEKAFIENPHASEMLTVTGAAHVPGVHFLLLERGWTEMTIDEYSASPL